MLANVTLVTVQLYRSSVTLRILGASKLLKFNHCRVAFYHTSADIHIMHTGGSLTKKALTITLNTGNKHDNFLYITHNFHITNIQSTTFPVQVRDHEINIG